MHRPAKLLRPVALGIERRRGASAAAGVRPAGASSSRRRRHIDGRVAERAPHPLERSGISVEHDDSAVPVSVRDEGLVGLGPHEDVRRLVDGLRVGVAFAGGPATDLQQEFALVVEREEHVVVQIPERRCNRGAAADPHAVLVVDGDAVLAVRPVVAVAGAAPRVHEFSRRVELQHRRRRVAPPILGDRVRPVQHPHVIASIHRHRCDMTHDPAVRQLRPCRVHFEDGEPACVRGRLRLCVTVRECRDRHHHRDAGSDDADLANRLDAGSRSEFVDRFMCWPSVANAWCSGLSWSGSRLSWAGWTEDPGRRTGLWTLVLRVVVVPADVQPEDVRRDLAEAVVEVRRVEEHIARHSDD